MSNTRILWLSLSLLCIWIGVRKEVEVHRDKVAVRNGKEKLLYILDSLGIQYPEVVLAQAIHETGRFSSKIYKENHNMFGMKASRRSYDCGNHLGHAMYSHKPHTGDCNYECYISSMLDYRDWQRANIPLDKITTNWEYLNALQNLSNGCSYAEDREYIPKVQKYVLLIQEL